MKDGEKNHPILSTNKEKSSRAYTSGRRVGGRGMMTVTTNDDHFQDQDHDGVGEGFDGDRVVWRMSWSDSSSYSVGHRDTALQRLSFDASVVVFAHFQMHGDFHRLPHSFRPSVFRHPCLFILRTPT